MINTNQNNLEENKELRYYISDLTEQGFSISQIVSMMNLIHVIFRPTKNIRQLTIEEMSDKLRFAFNNLPMTDPNEVITYVVEQMMLDEEKYENSNI